MPVEDPELALLGFPNEDCVSFHNPLSGLSSGKWPKHAERIRQRFFLIIQMKPRRQQLAGCQRLGHQDTVVAGHAAGAVDVCIE